MSADASSARHRTAHETRIELNKTLAQERRLAVLLGASLPQRERVEAERSLQIFQGQRASLEFELRRRVLDEQRAIVDLEQAKLIAADEAIASALSRYDEARAYWEAADVDLRNAVAALGAIKSNINTARLSMEAVQ